MQLSLLDDVPASAGPTRREKKRMRNGAGWTLVDHACRHCGGRVLQREATDGSYVVRCSICGKSAQGGHDALCACGEEVSGLGRVWECFLNPNPSPACPQEVLVRERPFARAPEGRAVRPVRTVNVPDF